MTAADPSPVIPDPGRSPSPEQERQRLRERLRCRFEVWLDEALNPEAVPAGLAPEILDQLEADALGDNAELDVDLRAVCATLVGLTTAAQGQGEAFAALSAEMPAIHGLTDQVTTFLATLTSEQERLREERKREDEARDVRAHREVFRRVLDTVVALRDRLTEGLERTAAAADAPPATPPAKRRWWSRRPPTPPVDPAALARAVAPAREACRLARDQVDQALTQWHVEILGTVDQALDPENMTVVGHADRDDLPEGTVVAVRRAGYRWQGTLLRPAEVTVSRPTRPEVTG